MAVEVPKIVFIAAATVGAAMLLKTKERRAEARVRANRRKYLSPSSIRRYNLGDVAQDATAAARRGDCGAARRMLSTAPNTLPVEYARDRVEEVCAVMEETRSAPSFMGLGRRKRRRKSRR